MDLKNLALKEQAIEALCTGRGIERYLGALDRNRKQKTETKVVASPARVALKKSIEPCTAAFTQLLEERKNKRGPKPLAMSFIEALGADVTAYLTAMAVLDSLSSTVQHASVCKKIAGYFVDELRYRHFAQHAEALFDWRMKSFNTSSYVHMKRSLDATLLYAQQVNPKTGEPSIPAVPEWLHIDNAQRLQIGAYAFQVFMAATGYVELVEVYNSKTSRVNLVRATESTESWMAQIRKDNADLAPVCLPMVIEPAAWSPESHGGYYFTEAEGGLAGKHPLVRPMFTSTSTKGYEQVAMPVVYEALNAIQITPYVVNERVLQTMAYFYDNGLPVAGLPINNPKPMPVKPHDIDTNLEASKKWRKAASITHEENHESACQRKTFLDTLTVARLMLSQKDDDGQVLPFYFPHNLDFRGRCYPIPVYMQPQGDDISRGLLLLGTKKALRTQEAVDWFCIHGANNLGKTAQGEALDKASFEERIQWILNHSEQICSAATAPAEFRSFWAGDNVDNPWQFLAFCFEWKKFCDSGRSLSFECQLPGSMDGSCNGLQHYAALLKDEELAKSVNLIPSAIPQDIYRVVSAETNKNLLADARSKRTVVSQKKVVAEDGTTSVEERSNPVYKSAEMWIKWAKVDRKFVKRPVMTLPYGSGRFGFKGQIKEFLKGLSAKDRPAFWKTDDESKAIMYMAGTIFGSLAVSSRAAVQAMKFFQDCARMAAKGDTPIQWTAPSGLVVQQAYPRMLDKQIDTMLAGKIRCRTSYQEPAMDEQGVTLLNPSKQVSGIAPNIIHSLDASAMMFTVVAAKAEGIDHFLMVHDSFGCHMADAPRMSEIVRETFTRMYAGSTVLDGLVADLISNIDVKALPEGKTLPVAPAQGNLDINLVLESKYFFA